MGVRIDTVDSDVQAARSHRCIRNREAAMQGDIPGLVKASW